MCSIINLMSMCIMANTTLPSALMVVGWLALHEEEAYAAWNKAVRGEPFEKIQPLR